MPPQTSPRRAPARPDPRRKPSSTRNSGRPPTAAARTARERRSSSASPSLPRAGDPATRPGGSRSVPRSSGGRSPVPPAPRRRRRGPGDGVPPRQPYVRRASSLRVDTGPDEAEDAVHVHDAVLVESGPSGGAPRRLNRLLSTAQFALPQGPVAAPDTPGSDVSAASPHGAVPAAPMFPPTPRRLFANGAHRSTIDEGGAVIAQEYEVTVCMPAPPELCEVRDEASARAVPTIFFTMRGPVVDHLDIDVDVPPGSPLGASFSHSNLVVTSISGEGVAALYGIRPGSLLLAIDGQRYMTNEELRARMVDPTPLNTMRFRVPLSWEDSFELDPRFEGGGRLVNGLFDPHYPLGMVFNTDDEGKCMDDDMAREFDGLLIEDVHPNSQADHQGVVRGAMLLNVGGHPIESTTDVLESIARARDAMSPSVQMQFLAPRDEAADLDAEDLEDEAAAAAGDPTHRGRRNEEMYQLSKERNSYNTEGDAQDLASFAAAEGRALVVPPSPIAEPLPEEGLKESPTKSEWKNLRNERTGVLRQDTLSPPGSRATTLASSGGISRGDEGAGDGREGWESLVGRHSTPPGDGPRVNLALGLG